MLHRLMAYVKQSLPSLIGCFFLAVMICSLPLGGILGIVITRDVGVAGPRVGDTVTVVANPSSQYSVEGGARVADSLDNFSYMSGLFRDKDHAGIESRTRRGLILILSVGEQVKIIRSDWQLEEVYEVCVLTGPYTGRNLFISWSNVARPEVSK